MQIRLQLVVDEQQPNGQEPFVIGATSLSLLAVGLSDSKLR